MYILFMLNAMNSLFTYIICFTDTKLAHFLMIFLTFQKELIFFQMRIKITNIHVNQVNYTNKFMASSSSECFVSLSYAQFSVN